VLVPDVEGKTLVHLGPKTCMTLTDWKSQGPSGHAQKVQLSMFCSKVMPYVLNSKNEIEFSVHRA
jgi:hypothetical protein